MITQGNETIYLETLKDRLLHPSNFNQVILTRQLANKIPSKAAGMYAFKSENKIVYIGETGNLRGHMKDLLDSRLNAFNSNNELETVKLIEPVFNLLS